MFGKNPVERSEIDGDGKSLRVVRGSPFYTIQGEGPFAGMPAVFLRLHGCPLRCYFCDTEFSSPQDPRYNVSHIQELIRDAGDTASGKQCRLLVITGGEPVRQNLEGLVAWARVSGWTVQVETSGILWQDCLTLTEIVVSPKTGVINEDIAFHARAFKYVISATAESDRADGLPILNTQDANGKPIRLARPWDHSLGMSEVYLSPMDEYDPVKNEANVKEVARLAMKHGYRAGLQLHKHFNLP
jgi:7-carboxy-7-deazaguanine synthase